MRVERQRGERLPGRVHTFPSLGAEAPDTRKRGIAGPAGQISRRSGGLGGTLPPPSSPLGSGRRRARGRLLFPLLGADGTRDACASHAPGALLLPSLPGGQDEPFSLSFSLGHQGDAGASRPVHRSIFGVLIPHFVPSVAAIRSGRPRLTRTGQTGLRLPPAIPIVRGLSSPCVPGSLAHSPRVLRPRLAASDPPASMGHSLGWHVTIEHRLALGAPGVADRFIADPAQGIGEDREHAVRGVEAGP